jgi:hypothetical protein
MYSNTLNASKAASEKKDQEGVDIVEIKPFKKISSIVVPPPPAAAASILEDPMEIDNELSHGSHVRGKSITSAAVTVSIPSNYISIAPASNANSGNGGKEHRILYLAKRWSAAETDSLLKGVQKHGKSWVNILADPEFAAVLKNRSAEHCRAKYRVYQQKQNKAVDEAEQENLRRKSEAIVEQKETNKGKKKTHHDRNKKRKHHDEESDTEDSDDSEETEESQSSSDSDSSDSEEENTEARNHIKPKHHQKTQRVNGKRKSALKKTSMVNRKEETSEEEDNDQMEKESRKKKRHKVSEKVLLESDSSAESMMESADELVLTD